MAAPPTAPTLLQPEIGPDGLARDSPVIAYTERVIAEEQLQLKKYIKENYAKIRDVERELENLNLELKLTAGPKKAALEHLRKKIELSTERIQLAKQKEEQAKKAWEAAAQLVKDEEDAKQKLCDDLNRLVRESASAQYARLEELKKRLESLNPGRGSTDVSAQKSQNPQPAIVGAQPHDQQQQSSVSDRPATNQPHAANSSVAQHQKPSADTRDRKRPTSAASGRGRGGVLILPKGRGASGSGWTGAGFDVDEGT